MIELIVVLAIIMILMAIMLPVFMRAKNHAVGGVCMSNLAQIHKALVLYSDAHAGGGLGTSGAVYPPDLYALQLPAKVVGCKGLTPFPPMWHSASEVSSPVLVVDNNRETHLGRALGLFADGAVRRRGGEGDPLSQSFWR